MKIEKYLGNINILESTLKYAYDNFIPLVTTIELTQACNFSCHHCYNFDRTKLAHHPEKNKSMSTNRILTLIDELSDAGAFFLNFSGGEALANPELLTYIKAARQKHMEVRLKTNAALITLKKANELKEAGLCGVDISLYGMSDESYHKLTQVQGALSKVKEAIKNLKENKIDIHISIILHRYNISELDKMIDFCKKENLLYQISTEITERYDKSLGARDYEITNEQFEELLNSDYGHLFQTKNPKGSYQCSCARSVCGISHSGEVYPCIGAPIPSGNINDSSFINIWKNSNPLNKIRNLKTQDFKSCVTCDVQENCNRSSGSIFINTGDYTGCEEVTLSQAKIRAKNDKY